MKVLIIEDEPYAQEELKRLLSLTGETIEILDCLDSIDDSVDWLRRNPRPDLIFLDIQLSDGLSFDIFKQIKISVPVIFTTAYNEFAIQAFKLNSIDYLLKPIELEDLRVALDKFRDLKSQFGSNDSFFSEDQIRQLLQREPEYKSRFLTKVGDQIRHIPVKEVAYFQAEDNLVFLINREGKRMIVDYTLEQLVQSLNPKLFFRLNRTYIAHIESIGKVSKYFNSRLKVDLVPANQEEVLVSRVKVPEFLKWMDQ